LLLSFIQVGGLHGVEIILILGFIDKIVFKTGIKLTLSGAILNLF